MFEETLTSLFPVFQCSVSILASCSKTLACFISCSLRERKEERGQQSFIFISVPPMTAINHLYYEWSIPFSHFRHLFYLFSLSLALCLGFEGTALSLSAESAPVRLVEKEKSCNQCL